LKALKGKTANKIYHNSSLTPRFKLSIKISKKYKNISKCIFDVIRHIFSYFWLFYIKGVRRVVLQQVYLSHNGLVLV
jgi:hypothetical protein